MSPNRCETRRLGIDRHDLAGSLAAFTGGVERLIDVAEVNGRMFVNNVSLGIYGDAVARPGYRDAKVRTLLETAQEVLGPSAPAPGLRLADDQGREHSDLAVVLVSNNPYALDSPFAPGTRAALGTGQLGIVILHRPGNPPRPPGLAWTVPRLEVSAPVPVHAGIDGEPVDLVPPLRFTIRPSALKVRISSRHPGASPSARFSRPGTTRGPGAARERSTKRGLPGPGPAWDSSSLARGHGSGGHGCGVSHPAPIWSDLCQARDML